MSGLFSKEWLLAIIGVRHRNEKSTIVNPMNNLCVEIEKNLSVFILTSFDICAFILEPKALKSRANHQDSAQHHQPQFHYEKSYFKQLRKKSPANIG
jgi:hypothetical protein